MKIVGLTGGIASGKSLVSNWFSNLHIEVIDADKVYKSLIKTNHQMVDEIQGYFNLELTEHGLDLKALATIVFNDQEKLKKLNQMTHPYVIHEIKQMIDQAKIRKVKMMILDVPLLFEAKMEHLCDVIICVYTDRETQIERLMNRGHLERDTAIQRIDAQMSLETKKELADYIIDNSGSKDESYHQFIQIYAKLIAE